MSQKSPENPTYDLSAKNPNKKEAIALRQPQQILEEMKALDAETNLLLDNLNLLIGNA